MLQRLVVILLLFNFCETKAQQARPPVVNFTPKNYGTQQTPENYSIFQDNRGYIFAGNSGGLLMFDGSTWDFIEVQNGAYVTAIDQDTSGNIYVGTSGGEFGKLVVTKNGALKFRSLKKWFEKQNLSLTWSQKLFCVGNDVYIYTPDNLFYIHQTKIHTVPTNNSFQLIHKVNNRIYARERNVGLIEIKGTQKKLLAENPEFKQYGILGLTPYDKNNLLVITQEKGLWLFNQKNKTALCINSDSVKLKQHLIIGGIALSDGNFAVNTLASGIILFDKNGRIKSFINKSSGLRVNDIKQITEDKHHNIWMATSNGIGLVNYASFLHFYDDETGLLGGIECVTRCGKNIYVGTSEGLFAETIGDPNKHFAQITQINGQVWDIDNFKDKVVVASDGGIFVGKESSFKQIFENPINTITFITDTKILAAGKDAVYFIDLITENVISESFFDYPVARCLSIKKDPSPTEKPVAWLGTLGSGIYKITVLDTGLVLTLYNNLDDHSLAFTSPVIINKKVFFCTSGGLRKLTENQGKPFFDYAEILPELDAVRVTDIKQLGKRIWVCAENKVFHFDDSLKPVTTPFLPIDMGRINNLYVETDKSCWIAAADGLIRYVETYDKNYNTVYDVVIRNIVVNNDSTIFHGNWFQKNQLVNQQPNNKTFQLAYKFNAYEFTVSALYYEGIDKLVYAHLLEGHEEEWSSWSTENKIKYSNLREGDYVLKIKAKNVYGFESRTLEFKFSILPPWYRTTMAYVGYILAVVLLFFGINRILSYRLKQRNMQLENLVKKRTKEVERKNIELNKQNIQIKHQKQEITDSINYAQKIQEAMLPFDKELKRDIPDSFVLFKPKDIVSGDFYWYGTFEQKQILICADCTGHGVPGAFMSMLCIDKLNQIIPEKKVLMPDKILEETNKGIKKSLGQSDEHNLKTKDGMDAAVVTIDQTNRTLYFAGANRPLWLIRNGELIEFAANKCSVGGFTVEEQVFNAHVIPLQPGDQFYMSTDGYADQFGGPKGKKIMVRNFKDLILKNKHLSFNAQNTLLDTFLENWKKGSQPNAEQTEQVDDICVIGFKL